MKIGHLLAIAASRPLLPGSALLLSAPFALLGAVADVYPWVTGVEAR